MSSAAEQPFSFDVLLRSNKSYPPASIATATTSKSLVTATAVASEATPLIRDSQHSETGIGGNPNHSNYSTRHGSGKLNSDVLANVSQCMATNLTTNILGVLLPSLNTMVGNSESGGTDLRHTSQQADSVEQANGVGDKQSQPESQSLLGAAAPPSSDTDRILELEDSVIAWQDKYNRLYESHKRVQKVNQSLEDKLLKLVDRNTGERVQLTSDVATLSVRLAQANFNIAKLQHEIDRYKSDINLAIQLLQCKPDNFVPQKVSSLPIDIQSKVSCYMRLESNSHSDSEGSPTGMDSAGKGHPASKSPKLETTTQPFAPTVARAKDYLMSGIDASGIRTGNLNNNNITDYAVDADNNNKNIHNNNNNNNSNNNHNHSITRQNHKNEMPNDLSSPNGNSNSKNLAMLNNQQSPNPISTPTTTKAIAKPPQAAQPRLPDPDLISPITMAKFLTDELKAAELKHCETCQCSKQDLTVLADVSRSYTVATQTSLGSKSTALAQLCLRCNSNLSPPAQSCPAEAYLMELVKPAGPAQKVAAKKPAVADNAPDLHGLHSGKLMLSLPPPTRDDILLNPILGHHRMCGERTLTGDSGAETETAAAKGSSLVAAVAAAHCLSAAAKSQPGHYGSYGGDRTAAVGPCQRRFLDGGGTALDLLEKFEHKTNVGGSHFFGGGGSSHKPKPYMPLSVLGDEFNDKDELADETKPLLLSEAADKDTDVVEGVRGSGEAVSVTATAVETTASVATERSHPVIATNPVNSPGSVTSVWSRTSSCEGVKMFENFNRNLIKTIKAENPKHLGPRLCAMRIQQNGQSNILLDSLESFEAAAPPVIYKRRERLLDEELGDEGNVIISSQTAPKTSPVDLLTFCSPFIGDATLENPLAVAASTSSIGNCGQLDQANASWLTMDPAGEGNPGAGAAPGASGGNLLEEDDGEPDLNDDIDDDVEDDEDEEVDDEVDDDDDEVECIMAIDTLDSEMGSESAGALAAAHHAKCKLNGEESAAEEANSSTGPLFEAKTSYFQGGRKLGDFEKYLGIEPKPADPKAAAEPSAGRYLSSHAEVADLIDDVADLQATAMFRRQQLSRVAEWVQSNTQQLAQAEAEPSPLDSDPLPVALKGKPAAFGAFGKIAGDTLDQLEDFVSVENPSSLDSGYKTTPQPPPNGVNSAAHLIGDAAAKSSAGDSLSPKTDATNSMVDSSNSVSHANVPSVHTQYRRITRSGLSVAYTTTSAASVLPASFIPAGTQPTCDILNYKYYPSTADKSRSVQAELHTSTRNVDIAQMEYNVKQFLLKQDEWSMRSGRRPTVVNVQALSGRSVKIRRSKHFGPGVGERVVVSGTAAATTTTSYNTLRSGAEASEQGGGGGAGVSQSGFVDLPMARSSVAAKLPTIPQRTETNL